MSLLFIGGGKEDANMSQFKRKSKPLLVKQQILLHVPASYHADYGLQ